jgi:hypothetical protein
MNGFGIPEFVSIGNRSSGLCLIDGSVLICFGGGAVVWLVLLCFLRFLLLVFFFALLHCVFASLVGLCDAATVGAVCCIWFLLFPPWYVLYHGCGLYIICYF